MAIYVERFIHTAMDPLWKLTQSPEEHQRWDLRFSRITYLPHDVAAGPQQFSYETRLGFGLVIAGTGVTTGARRAADGTSSSALVFRSADRKSLIRKGSGYWQYAPADGGVRFRTAYDYRTRWGLAGWMADRLLFRPLMAWATAWSFDRLGAWLERGTPPETTRRIALAYTLARLMLAFIWLYEGLVPKLLGPHPDELAMTAALLGRAATPAVIGVLGITEVVLGTVMVLRWRARWPAWLSILAMPVALAGAAIAGPSSLTAPFNPVTLNLAVMVLASITLVLRPDLVSADACRWTARGRRLSGIYGNL